MVTFAPQVAPTNDPNYLNYSKPISDIQADKSQGMLLKGIGDALEGAASLGDTITKQVINEEVRTGVDKQRDAFTASLVAYSDMQSGAGLVPSPETQGQAGIKAPMSLTGDEENLPAGVKAGVAKAQAIGTAMTQNAGKANDTLYTGALTALTKDLRNRYPGYRDYIDNKIAEVSGINPANAYMRNLLEDINRNATSGRAETDKAIALGRQYLGYDPNMPAYIEAVRQGLPGAIQNLESRINKVASDKPKFDELERLRKMREWRREDDATEQSVQFSKEIRSKANLAWQGVVEIPGLNNPTTIQKLIDDQRAGRIALTDEQNTALLNAATLAKDTWQRQAVEIMRNRGYTQSIPDKKKRDEILADEGRFFDDQIAAINSKDNGTMFGNQRRLASIQSDTSVSLLSDKNAGAYWRIVDAAKRSGGDGWVNFVQAEALKAGVTNTMKDFIQDTKLKIGTPRDPRNPSDTRSIYEDIKKVQEANVPAESKVYDDLIGNVKLLALPSAPKGVTEEQFFNVKKNIIDYMYDPAKNGKLMDRFSRDFVDSDGVRHPGKFAVYDVMTQRAQVDKIWEMKDRDSWQKYRDWNELSFRKLFSEEIGQLNQIANAPVKLLWNSDTKQFTVERDIKTPTPGIEPTLSERATIGRLSPAAERSFQALKEGIEVRLNRGLSNLAYMHDKEGMDTNTYLMDTLMQMGYSPNDRLRGHNLPQKVIEAIANAKKKELRIEEAFDAARGKK